MGGNKFNSSKKKVIKKYMRWSPFLQSYSIVQTVGSMTMNIIKKLKSDLR